MPEITGTGIPTTWDVGLALVVVVCVVAVVAVVVALVRLGRRGSGRG